jgi:hypothetical protein
VSKLKALVKKVEASKTGAQVFRVVRITAVGIVTAVLSHNAVTAASVTALVEAAFRQVFTP